MLEFLTLKQSCFGLDISDLSLRIAKLKERKKVLRLASFGEFPLPKGVIEKGEVKDKKGLSKAIKTICKEAKGEKLKTRYVVASLPEEKSFLQVIQMPIMKKEELKKAVRFEAENYIPLSIEEVYFDSQIVPSVNKKSKHLNVLIAALPKKIVDPYVNAIKDAGLILKALEIEPLSISRALIGEKNIPFTLFLIDIGATRTSIVIFSNSSARFTSTIPVSSQEFTDAVSRNLQIDPIKAEKMKIKYGLEKKGSAGKTVFDAIIPCLTDLTEQIRRCIRYYQTHAIGGNLSSGSEKTAKIILCGGGANLKGLENFLAMEFKIPVELGNPWINILPQPLKEVPEISFKESLGYSTALGLALRELGHNGAYNDHI